MVESMTHTDDGHKIDAYGIPEGCKPKDSIFPWDSVIYIDENGEERFRYNQGCCIRELC